MRSAPSTGTGCSCCTGSQGHAVRIERIHVGLATVPMVSSRPRRPFRGSSHRSSSRALDVGAPWRRGFGRHSRTPTEASSTTSGSGCSAAWNGGLLAESSLSADDFFSIIPQSSRHSARQQARPARTHPCARLGQIIVAACSRPDLLSLTNGGHSGGAGRPPLEGPGQVGSPPPLPSSRLEALGNGQGQEPCCPCSVRFCASTHCTASRSSPG